jgi:NADPH:quinone reductase-like Zn-dependent oxidoreductase
MRAVTIREYGGIEQLRYEELPEPEPGPGEVLVRLRAAALNHLDIWVREGLRPRPLEGPHVLGSDGAGVIEELGPGVEGLAQGEAVLINPALSCGHCPWCEAGEDSLCERFDILGLGRPGTFAEFVAVPAANVAPIPGGLSFVEAAATPLVGLTAWRMMITKARPLPGETVLVLGVGGGVSGVCVQLAALCGARTIASSRSEAKLERARGLGAQEAILYRDNDQLVRQVRELTGGRGADIVVDNIGAATWLGSLAAVARGGRIITNGCTTGCDPRTDLRAIYWKQLSILGSTMGSRSEFRQLLEAVGQGRLRPTLDSTFPLQEAAKAQARMEAGEQFGKIVLTIPE